MSVFGDMHDECVEHLSLIPTTLRESVGALGGALLLFHVDRVFAWADQAASAWVDVPLHGASCCELLGHDFVSCPVQRCVDMRENVHWTSRVPDPADGSGLFKYLGMPLDVSGDENDYILVVMSKLSMSSFVDVLDDVCPRETPGLLDALESPSGFCEPASALPGSNKDFYQSAVPHFICDESGSLLQINSACRTLTGYTQDEVFGWDVEMIFATETTFLCVDEWLLSCGSWSGEAMCIGRNESTPVLLQIARVTEADSIFHVGRILSVYNKSTNEDSDQETRKVTLIDFPIPLKRDMSDGGVVTQSVSAEIRPFVRKGS